MSYHTKNSQEAIDYFFQSFSLPHAKTYLIAAVKAAERAHVWDSGTPYDLLYFFENLKALLPIVYDIVKSGNKSKKVILTNPPHTADLTRYDLYCGGFNQYKPWDYFPRYLGREEYHNPYKALETFTEASTKQQWFENLQGIQCCALSNNSLSELGICLELVSLTELLQKMLEACHLIYVRTTRKP
ncbi:MAG: hypothetical protein V4450_03150 [Bacteroidota bacterium]